MSRARALERKSKLKLKSSETKAGGEFNLISGRAQIIDGRKSSGNFTRSRQQINIGAKEAIGSRPAKIRAALLRERRTREAVVLKGCRLKVAAARRSECERASLAGRPKSGSAHVITNPISWGAED